MPTRRSVLAALAGGCSVAALRGRARAAGPNDPAPVARPLTPQRPINTWHRLSRTPLLAPRGTGFESAGVFNPSAVKVRDGVVLLYRAQDKLGTSRIGYAKSADGLHFERNPEPVLSPTASYEREGGVEDPRVVRIGDRYLLTYTAYDSVAQTAQLCLATSTDLLHWDRHGVILPANEGTWNVHWTKSGAIVPQKIGGRWYMYYLGESNENPAGQMGLAVSDDLMTWRDATRAPVLHTRPRFFDSAVCEPGPAPIVLDEGILLIYNGANDYLVYSTGWVLFDRNDPSKVLARSDEPTFGAEEPWERVGQVPNVVFVEGLIRDGSKLTCYYGGADTCIGAATTALHAE